MRSLATNEVHLVSGGAVDFFDLAYLFSGYHHFDMNYTIGAGFGMGTLMGIINVALPAAGAPPIVGFMSTATWIAVPALVGAAFAFVEYQIGSFCSSLVNQN
jgi:hypothetical protein